jgi:hypothetical protein
MQFLASFLLLRPVQGKQTFSTECTLVPRPNDAVAYAGGIEGMYSALKPSHKDKASDERGPVQ